MMQSSLLTTMSFRRDIHAACRPADHNNPKSLADSGYIHAADHDPIVFADNDISTELSYIHAIPSCRPP